MVVCPGRTGSMAERSGIRRRRRAAGGDVKAVPLGPDFADDVRMMEFKRRIWTALRGESAWEGAEVALAEGEKFAGSEACSACHAEAYKVWKASGHAHALDTLARVKDDRDPECVQCHVVGLDRKTGFESREKSAASAT